MEQAKKILEQIEQLRCKLYLFLSKPEMINDPEVIKLNYDLNNLIVEYTKICNKLYL
ncbi:Spo0E family sporulation regulatory protein-aspartic acid phosphatase [Bacillota bacterium LX-D]|nr:Spo0E family sporulation regulatory protein-aspartic acid phosphatase [Bacillota bacterium LX-D]